MSERQEKAVLPGVETARWRASGLDDLIEHITSRHHAYIRSELPWMERAITRAVEAGGRAGADALVPLSRSFRFFKRELELHLRKEEEILFPLIQQMESLASSGDSPLLHSFGSIANPIGILEEDHKGERHQIRRMFDWLGSYHASPPVARILGSFTDHLRALDADMRVHVHLEDEILFPRVRLLEES
ncbi:MAG: hemerythrin domain-containing protein [Bryobacterales bacterium]|nr:hemerythrin domain-containing protein [Bryobacterales bacterium]